MGSEEGEGMDRDRHTMLRRPGIAEATLLRGGHVFSKRTVRFIKSDDEGEIHGCQAFHLDDALLFLSLYPRKSVVKLANF